MVRRLLPARWHSSRHRDAVEKALDDVDMLAYAERQPYQADKKRVLLARALAQAKIPLLDEPLAGVDPP